MRATVAFNGLSIGNIIASLPSKIQMIDKDLIFAKSNLKML